MAIPAHADPRSHKHFTRYFVGKKGEDPGQHGHQTSWNSTSDALPTRTMGASQHVRYCVYCGNRAFPIQSDVGAPVKGFSCVCKDAMDEIEWHHHRQDMLDRHAKERSDLDKLAPKQNMEAVAKYAEALCSGFVNDIRNGTLSNSVYGHLGITFNDPSINRDH